ncbi:MAG TPA: bifunctional hydroxymethylpyrimidine kinase/phosphomethylpyrimidine kinase [Nanoarchaeota archaeon]|nr:bifunctional hydroxymethylpyrimidine kinase/phosphomethylpyrimidine kinase [Nanoarchaeota archaeon]
MREVKTALTIAGSDSGGGAGIEADLKTFSCFGVHGLVAITSVTAQNTQEVIGVYDIIPEIVSKQIEAVAKDIGIDAAKTGMLSNACIIKAVAKTVKKYSFPLVVDPVMIAKSGAFLLKEDAVDALIEKIIPLATLVTPNKFEAEKLSGIKIKNIEDAKKSARIIVKNLGAEAVIIKKAYTKLGKVVDVLYYQGKFKEYKARFVDGCTHGSGCSFSAAITANLAKGENLEKAIKIAKKFITMGIYYGIKIGKGCCPVNQNAWIEILAEKWRVYNKLSKAVKKLETFLEKLLFYAPKESIKLIYSLPKLYTKAPKDIGAVYFKNKSNSAFCIKFGVSKNLARVILKIMKFYPELRSALSIKYNEKIIEKAKTLGINVLKITEFDFKEKPEIICFDNTILILAENPENAVKKLEKFI